MREILPDLILPSRTHLNCLYTGIDSPSSTDNIDWFNEYPHSIDYSFNSRGFRDTEWPESVDDLKNAVWCFGDSYTVGLGSPIEHSWVKVLQNRAACRTINVSMDGASNDWISRRVKQVKHQINPTNIIIMWSFLHRRELDCLVLPDEDRRIWNTKCSTTEDLKNFKECVLPFINVSGIQNYIIPGANQYSDWLTIWDQVKGPDWPEQPTTTRAFLEMPQWVVDELKQFGVYKKLFTAISTNEPFSNICKELGITQVVAVDKARDNHHFDVLTSNNIVSNMLCRLAY